MGQKSPVDEEASKSHHKSKRKHSSDYNDDDANSVDIRGSESEEGSKHSSRSSGKRSRSRSTKHRSRRKYSDDDDDDSSSSYSESESESEEERRRRKRRERKRREEKERRRRRRDKEKKKMKKKKREKGDDSYSDDDDSDDSKRRRKKKKSKKKDKKKEKGKAGAVTNSWGKYGIIRETDMWNKRPEFTAWLLEVKQVNLESLPNWEEKQMFKQFMEDHNTGTFTSKKYYSLDAYHNRQIEKQMKKGFKKVLDSERIVFNDEEQRRLEMQQAREKQKEEQVEALKLAMQSGQAQAMKEQAQLREEMAYQYKLGNFEAAAAIQRRLDPDVAM